MPSISLLVQVAALAAYPCGCSQLLSHPDKLVASQSWRSALAINIHQEARKVTRSVERS